MLRPLSLLTLLLAGHACAADSFMLSNPEHTAVAMVERYPLQSPASFNIPYDGEFKAAFPGGFPFAPGSGLALKKIDKDGSLIFWAISDRGPNGDAPKVAQGDKKLASKVFPASAFVPQLVEIRVSLADKATVIRSQPLHFDKEPASGLPLPAGTTGSTGEVALSDTLTTLAPSPRGIDPEGVSVDKEGKLWLADEYGPFLLQVDPATGQILQQLAPGKGLPDVLASRQPNRGFEGVAVAPNGKVYAVVQSTLDLNKETRSTAGLIRMVEYDPGTGQSRMFAYPLDPVYKKNGDAKLGDLVAIDNTRFLTIEQGKGADKKMRNVLYVLDIAGADDLGSKKLADGREFEYASKDELAGLKLIRKQRIADLRELGWQAEKAEGLALVEGRIAVINDNDFGLKAEIDGASSKDAEDAVLVDGKLAQGRYVLKPNQDSTELWLLHLKQGLSSYFPR
ncbi:esterase-like activity of phytase family protein [Chitinilyticum piscinae]|uniref:Esterase-like activity of phytase family protein n=1 Tax=Chitinilyticum piscinae TaxID=2866724 RepID=A0A8J7K1I3_9NEIS|nr:esterase-like activity of phytase family protein [Chitinilyticum piscinae]MBE9609251.1 esterase-like activity of phytase family protein [Chitinilyticum piscinae]